MARGIIFFVLLFAAFLLTGAGLLLAALLGPPPYVLTGAGVPQQWLDGRDVGGQAHVRVERQESASDAARWAKARLRRLHPDFRSTDFTGFARYHDDDSAGMLVPIGNYVIEIAANSPDAADAAFASLDFIHENPDKGLAWLFEKHLGMVIGGIFLWAAIIALAAARGASWANTLQPAAGAISVSEDELRRRILDINNQNVPFTIVQDRRRRLKVEWRLADARWRHLIQTNRFQRIERLVLEFDDRSRKVRVLESSYVYRRSAGLFGIFARLQFWSGIRFGGVELATALGLTYGLADGWKLQKAYSYRFRVGELKSPLAAVITRSGWVWKPVVTLFRPIGG